jgi:hypothetical protein
MLFNGTNRELRNIGVSAVLPVSLDSGPVMSVSMLWNGGSVGEVTVTRGAELVEAMAALVEVLVIGGITVGVSEGELLLERLIARCLALVSLYP